LPSVAADGQYHTYEIEFAATRHYTGIITQLRLDPGFIGKNLRYDLESTTELTPVDWQPVPGVTNILGDGSPKTFINPPSSAPAKFFRLKLRLE
jgi:hypothetical protein